MYFSGTKAMFFAVIAATYISVTLAHPIAARSDGETLDNARLAPSSEAGMLEDTFMEWYAHCANNIGYFVVS